MGPVKIYLPIPVVKHYVNMDKKPISSAERTDSDRLSRLPNTVLDPDDSEETRRFSW
jgi:hypothetical protein